jgi:hypothetical protein
MKSKKGIELSINFIVVIILSMVILGSGLYLVRSFFSNTVELKAQLDEQTKSKIVELLTYGDMTALPFNRKTINLEERAVFGLGILNINTYDGNFSVRIDAFNAYDKNNIIIPWFVHDNVNNDFKEENRWLKYDKAPFKVKAHEQAEIPILVNVPKNATKGVYTFDVTVYQDTSPYGNKNRMFVEVS